jgi:hypothetical protein
MHAESFLFDNQPDYYDDWPSGAPPTAGRSAQDPPLLPPFCYSSSVPENIPSTASSSSSSQAAKSSVPSRAPVREAAILKKLDPILAALKLAGLSPMAFVAELYCSSATRHEIYKTKLYDERSLNLSAFLDVVWESPKGKEHLLSWFHQHAVGIVEDIVSGEMEAAKRELFMSSNDVSTDYLSTWSFAKCMGPICQKVTPVWTSILHSAVTGKGSRDNVLKDNELVSQNV